MALVEDIAAEEFDRALSSYERAKATLIAESTRVLGSFICPQFVAEMQDGSLRLLEGLCETDGRQAKAKFENAAKRYDAMAIEGGIELAAEYINALKEDVQTFGTLFPEKHEAIVAPFNRASQLFDRVSNKEFTPDEAVRRIFEAVTLLRDAELGLGSISDGDVAQRVEAQRSATWDMASWMVFWAGIVFLIVRLVDRAGGISAIVAAF